MAFGRTLVRTGVILAIVGGGAVVIAGPGRIHALATQTRDGINTVIDSTIDDPVALRSQIKRLESEYPKKIAEVRSDLTEVQSQIAQMERELKVAGKVVALASDDLAQLDAVITQARDARADHPGAIIRVSFNNAKVNLDDAYAKRSQIEQTRTLYADRATDLGVDLSYLQQQENQLAELLTKLETERSEFQAKLFQLDAQIDTIARNERMLTMMEERQETIDRHNRYQAHSLDQLNKRLGSIRSEQRSRLEAIAGREQDLNYVDEAEYIINQENVNDTLDASFDDAEMLITPRVIDIDESGSRDPGPVAARSF